MSIINMKSSNMLLTPEIGSFSEVIVLSDDGCLDCSDEPLESAQAISGNEAAKLTIAEELLLQGLSSDAVCRILNIHTDLFMALDTVSKKYGSH